MKRKVFYSTSLVLILLILLSPLYCSTKTVDVPEYSKTGSRAFDKGSLEYHFGIPFVYLKGSDYEAGLQYGTLLKAEIADATLNGWEEFKNKIIRITKRDANFFMKPLVPMVLNHKLRKTRRQKIKILPESTHEFIRGMSEGSGLSKKYFYNIFVYADIMAGCSSFILNDGKQLLHARTFDFGHMGDFQAVITMELEGRQKFVTLNFITFILNFSVVNESGISFTENSNNNPQYIEKDKSHNFINHEKIHWYATDLNYVDSIVRNTYLPYDMNLVYGSSSEMQGTAYDAIGGEVKAQTPIEGDFYLHGGCTHPSIQKKLESINSARYHNMNRLDKFNELMTTDTSENLVDKAINIISNTGIYEYEDKLEVYYESINNYQSVQSVVFDAKNTTVYFAFAPYFSSWANWYKFNYETREVSLYKKEDPRFSSDITKAFVEACEFKNTLGWSNKKVLKKYALILENLKEEHLFAIEDLAYYYLYKAKDYEKANIYIERLIKNYPTIIFGKYYKARYFQLQGEYTEAIVNFNEVLELDIIPESWLRLTYENLAKCYDKVGNKSKRNMSIDKAVEIYNQYWKPSYTQERIDKLIALKNN